MLSSSKRRRSPYHQCSCAAPMNLCCLQVRAKALGDETVLEKVIEYVLEHFECCMTSVKSQDSSTDSAEDGALGDAMLVPACLEDDDSPAVDLLLALAQRYYPDSSTAI